MTNSPKKSGSISKTGPALIIEPQSSRGITKQYEVQAIPKDQLQHE